MTQGVSYGEYNTSAFQEEETPLKDGIEVLVSANLQAFKDRSYSMTIVLLDAEDHTVLMVGLDEPFVSTCENKSPRANEDVVTWRCWAVAPPEETEYYVRATLEDAGKTSEILDGPVIGQREALGFIKSDVFTAVPQHGDG